eukprot:CAMPEP_0194084746 /NCGR_PEP_ID=MMETSP0149-20130528/14765_1 /TAXON_ID=122233 /ORGANISM="Chaetoceros debilis, Strain MM31A-1" /LENGTH=901 /DNA_ID=CAMNT_0038767491 /DNA_START=99 /DNA_END=2804 /DNA_ORIENTATION=+
MKFNYKLHRLCGSAYGVPNATNTTSSSTSGGNILYTSSGNVLLSPVSNRVQVIDLLTHTATTLSCEARSNIKTIALSPDDRLLLIVDVDNHAMLVNFHRSVILHRFSFKRNVRICEFSPCGLYFAVSYGNHIQVWHAPGLRREFAPFVLHRTYTGLGDGVVDIQWSSDSSVVMACAKNGTTRIWSVQTVEGYEPATLSGHKSGVVGAYFEKISPGTGNRLRKVYTISGDGTVVSWSCSYSDDSEEDGTKNNLIESSNAAVSFFGGGSGNDLFTSNGTAANDESSSPQADHLVKAKWKATARHYFHQDTDVTATNFSMENNLLIVGFASGVFGLYELPSMSNIHTLSLSNQVIKTVAINSTGEWLAFGCPSTQQLLVWEWRSETYIIKQRGHAFGMKCMAYSSDGVVVATGGEDGSIKLWNTSSGFCYCTLKSHTAPITACVFSNSSVVLSASYDGTVRAHDLHRYRNFRTYTTPTPCQFTSLAVDPSGEVIVAGTMDPFHIYTWSMQSGKLLDILTGHVGPVSELTFHPTRGTLASASWDGTVKIWDLYKREGEPESIRHAQDVVCVSFRPDGKEMCTGTIGGLLSVWNVEDCSLICEIDGKKDIAGGRKMNDRMTSDSNASSRYFTSVCYSADGSCVLAGGNSKYICIYEVSQQILVKKFQVSFNRSLDGILDQLNSKLLGDGGPIDVNDASGDEADFSSNIPGAKRGDDGTRKSKVEVLTSQVAFSSTGREWAAVSNEGLHVYSLDDDMIFDPIALTEEITPGAVQSNLRDGKHSTALLISLHLNEFALVQQVLEETPYGSIPHVVKTIGPEHLERLMQYISKCMTGSPHLEFYMQWCLHLLRTHGNNMEKNRSSYMRAFRSMHRSVQIHHDELKRISNDNRYTLDFMQDQTQITLYRN